MAAAPWSYERGGVAERERIMRHAQCRLSSIVVVSDTEVHCVTPPGTGTVDVSIQSGGGSAVRVVWEDSRDTRSNVYFNQTRP